MHPVLGRNLRVARHGRLLLDVPEITFRDRKLTAIVGPNGAGKSLLIKILAGVMQPDSGEVTWSGRAPARVGYGKLSLVLQTPVLLRRTALANLAFALKAAGIGSEEARGQALAALEQAGLSEVARTSARLLSGGEKQRLALARALAIKPEVLFLDEPVANLDPPSTAAIEAMVREAGGRGVTVILVTHDLAQARRLSDDIVFMNRGRIEVRGEADDFFGDPRTRAARAYVAGELVV